MPIMKKGTHICEMCEKEFTWAWAPVARNGIVEVYSPKLLSELVRKEEGSGGKSVYMKNCPYCDYDNHWSEE